MSRKSFIESVGGTCRNWNWSWSFVNHDEKFVIFGQWDVHQDGLIFDEDWSGNGRSQSLEHIELIVQDEYKLKTFPMVRGKGENGRAKIAGFTPKLEDRELVAFSGRWYAVGKDENREKPIAEEVVEPDSYVEGATKSITINAYERNPKARAKCIDHYGAVCYACGFDFQDKYGEYGKGFIHVHHEVSLAEIKSEYNIDPVRDMKPLCPNCHGMVHRVHPPIAIVELVQLIER